MKVVDIKHVEDCFDGSLIKEMLLAEEISKEQIFALGQDGDVQYFPHFAKPFFKVRVKGLFDLKGIEGNKSMRVHLKNPKEYTMDTFSEMLSTIE